MSDLPYSDPSNPALPSPLFSDVTAVRGDHMRANNAAIFADLIELNARNPELVALTGGSFKTAALANANTYSGRSFFTCTAGVSDTPSAGAWRIIGYWNPTDSSGRFVAMADTSLEMWEINYSGGVWGTWKQRVDSSGNFVGIPETGLTLTDNTTGNVSVTAHGFAPKGMKRGCERRIISSTAADADHDITFAAGWMYDSTGAMLIELATDMTKQFDASWAAGTNAGGLLDGSLANDTWYAVWLMMKANGTVDIGADTVAAGVTNLPAGYTYYRRVRYFVTNGSANIIGMIQSGNTFLLSVPVRSYTANDPGTSAVLVPMICPPSMRALTYVCVDFAATSAAYLFGLVTSPLQADSTPSSSLFNVPVRSTNGRYGNYYGEVLTDGESRIRYRLDYSSTLVDVSVFSNGWIDTDI